MRVQRFDIGTLAPPRQNAQGFWICDGIASRCGVFEYLRADGSIQRELRVPEEVQAQHALDGYEGAALTYNHPRSSVTPKNVVDLSVGTVLEAAKADGDLIRVRLCIQADHAIQGVRDGSMRALSTGYSVELDHSPGVHPVYGRYDAVQRNLEINHLALCEAGRAGPLAKVKVDDARARLDWFAGIAPASLAARSHLMRAAGTRELRGDVAVALRRDYPGATAKLTTVVEGHQHSIDLNEMRNGIGTTSWSKSEDDEYGHSHEFVQNADGTITIALSDGHTHTVLADAGTTIDSKNNVAARNNRKGSSMPPEKKPEDKNDDKTGKQPAPAPAPKPHPNTHNLLAAATAQVAQEKARADAADEALAAANARADQAEGERDALAEKLKVAESLRGDEAVLLAKDEKIQDLEVKVGELEEKIDELEKPERLANAVKARVAIEKAAGKILGYEKMDNFSDKDLMVQVVEKLQNVDVSDKEDAYIRARFDVAVEGYKGSERAYSQIREIAKPAPTHKDGPSARDKYLAQQANGWKADASAGKAG